MAQQIVRDVIFVLGSLHSNGDKSELDSPKHLRSRVDLWSDDRGWTHYLGQEVQVSEKWPWVDALIANFSHTKDRKLSLVLIDTSIEALSLKGDSKLRGKELDRVLSTIRQSLSGHTVKLHGLIWIQSTPPKVKRNSSQQFTSELKLVIGTLVRAIGDRSLPVTVALVDPIFRTLTDFERSDHFNEHGYAVRNVTVNLEYESVPYEARLNLLAKKVLSALKSAETDRASFQDPRYVRQSIFDGEYLEAWYEGPPHAGKSARRFLVSFPSFSNFVDGRMEEPFAHRALSQRSILTIYIRSKKSDWFQNRELFPMLDAIRKFTGHNARLLCYGHSMGGFGAILAAKHLRATEVIAIAPQFSIDPKSKPYDDRWLPLHRQITKAGGHIYPIEQYIPSDIPIQILFDPADPDRKQAEAFGHGKNLSFIPMPFGTHNLLKFLIESGLLHEFMQGLPQKRLTRGEWIELRRKLRANSFSYWAGVSSYLRDRNPELSLKMLKSAQSSNGFRENYWNNAIAELNDIIAKKP